MERRKERIFKNTCIAVDVKTKKILSFWITDVHVHDSKALPGLVDGVIKSYNMTPTATTIGKLLVQMVMPSIIMMFLDVCGRQWNRVLY